MKHYIGIDVSKKKLDCLWLRDLEQLKIKTKVIINDQSGYCQLCSWLLSTTKQVADNIVVVMEATGIYHEPLAYALYESGFTVVVENPARVSAFAKTLGVTHKTDKQDSLLIARYGYTYCSKAWQPEKPEIRELKALIARLDALEADYRRESNSLEKAEFTASSTTVIHSIKVMLKDIRQEKLRVEKTINEHINCYSQLKRDRELLESILGIGAVVSRVMLSVIHSRRFKKAEELAAFIGVIPRLRESGVLRGRSSLSKKGPSSVRAKLYMAAIVAGQYNAHIIQQKKRLLGNGKTKMQALGAAMRKLAHLCFGVIKNQTEYSPLFMH